jgi:excisionase family DNA binding protein
MSEERLTPTRLRTAEEIAELLAVPVTWVREHTRAGTIPHVRLGRYIRYDEGQVFGWVAACRNGGRPTSFRRYTPATKNRAPAPRKRPGA